MNVFFILHIKKILFKAFDVKSWPKLKMEANFCGNYLTRERQSLASKELFYLLRKWAFVSFARINGKNFQQRRFKIKSVLRVTFIQVVLSSENFENAKKFS